jgi:pyruvate,water dikinase
MRFIKYLTTTKPNPNKLGSKASNLIKLFKAGIRVPNGFVVDTKSYKYFLKKTKLKQKLKQIFSKEYLAQDVLELSKKVKSLIIESEVPKKIRLNVKRAYNKFLSEFGKSISFAVRSSSKFEDLKDFSFAGQAESFLNNKDLNEILYSIKNCWGSLFNPQGLLYLLQLKRKNYKISPLELEMAVLIQKMVNAHVSGVLFTANVINNNLEQILINSTWGFGEVITNSSINPDSIILNKKQFEIVKKDIGEKAKMSIANNHTTSTMLIDTNKELREKCSLTNVQLKQLYELAINIEKLFNFPQDIEWAFEEEKVYTLQSRPITTLK